MGTWGPGNIGPGGPYQSNGQRISMEQAITIVEDYLQDRGGSDLEVTEIMEFDYNFYVICAETNAGIHAFEALIDPYTGDMYPEPGPNMMWNSKYGMMSGMMWGNQAESSDMTVSEAEAIEYAQEFIESYLPEASVEKPGSLLWLLYLACAQGRADIRYVECEWIHRAGLVSLLARQVPGNGRIC